MLISHFISSNQAVGSSNLSGRAIFSKDYWPSACRSAGSTSRPRSAPLHACTQLLPAQMSTDRAEHDAQDRTHYCRLAGEQRPQRDRDAGHPLTDGLGQQYLIEHQCGGVDHAPGAAVGAKAAALILHRRPAASGRACVKRTFCRHKSVFARKFVQTLMSVTEIAISTPKFSV